MKPIKFLKGTIGTLTQSATMTVNGTTNVPYRWTANITAIYTQNHNDNTTTRPSLYNGLDINVGDWVVSSGEGKCLKITAISVQAFNSASVTLEDDSNYNYLADQDLGGVIPSGTCFIFEVVNYKPLLGNIPASLGGLISGTEFTTCVENRFTSIAPSPIVTDPTSPLQVANKNYVDVGLSAKLNESARNTSNGFAGLGPDSKILDSQIPKIAITDSFVVGSQAAMLALTAEVGDVAIRTDLNKCYILQVAGAGTLGNWQELLAPSGGVSSVNGQTGPAVTISTITGNAGTVTGLSVAASKLLTAINILTLAGVDGKTLTINNNITLAGNDASTLNIGSGGTLGSAAYVSSGSFLASSGTPVIPAGATGTTQTLGTNNTTLATTAFVLANSGTGGGAGATLTDDSLTDSTFYPTFTSLTSGEMTAVSVSSSKLSFNPLTGDFTSPNFVTSSDERLKANIQNISNPFEILTQLTGKSYIMKDTGRKSYGFIAQELELILPELVSTNTDTGMKAVNYQATIGILLEAIKELNERLSILEG